MGALETEMGVACFLEAGGGGGTGRRRGAPFGAAFLPATAELISVDMLFRMRAQRHDLNCQLKHFQEAMTDTKKRDHDLRE